MPAPVPMEPMDTYLCVLLDLNLINATTTYTQSEICSTIASNQTSFDAIYNNPAARMNARTTYLSTAQMIDVRDKRGDCG